MATIRKRAAQSSKSTSQLRIIGGQWRSRRLSFMPQAGLRPTGDRLRETLFNWLAPWVRDARCLDLFAGSGALGLEALSRGAEFCDFVDSSHQTSAQIQQHLQTLEAQTLGACHSKTAAQFLAEMKTPYDIIFIDPPFGMDLVAPTLAALFETGLLAPEGWLYLEAPLQEQLPALPPRLQLHREKSAGGVACRLYNWHPS